MTYEDFVTFEQAQALKELGFDWECRNLYLVYRDNSICFLEYPLTDHEEQFIQIPAPTLAQAVKWLRDVKGLIVYVSPVILPNRSIAFLSSVLDVNRVVFGRNWYDPTFQSDTYEQALSAGIDRAIKLLKEE